MINVRAMPLLIFMLFLNFLAIPSHASPATTDHLDIYVFRSPGLDWTSPHALVLSLNASYSRIPKHPIGHVAIEYSCTADLTHKPLHEYAAMNMKNPTEPVDDLFVREIGLGLATGNLQGRIETKENIENYKNYHRKHSGMAHLRFLINHESCLRIHQFRTEFVASGTWHNYGLPDRPRYHEGSGCSAFGEAFLEVAGVMEKDWSPLWSRWIRVPDALIGDSNHKVPYQSLMELSPLTERWARPDEPSVPVFFYDPDLMYLWAGQTANALLNSPQTDMTLLEEGASFGIQWDRRGWETPNDPIWEN